MNVLDRLEELAGEATPRPWRTDASQPVGSWPYQIETPDGGLVVHQLEGTADAELIVAAVNALPDLLAVAKALQCMRDAERTADKTRGWPGHNQSLAARERAERQVEAALEPLLREAHP